MSALAAASVLADVSTPIPAPQLEYAALAPMLVVFGAACLGVLVEAFVDRPNRFSLQLAITVAGLAGALVAVFAYAAKGLAGHKILAQGAVTVDGPALFIQATVLVLALGGVMMMAEHRLDPIGDGFAPTASAIPGGADERDATTAGWRQTEVYPLTLFAVGGMLLFPAANDLLTMFVALEVLSLPLYIMCGLARRRRLISQEAALKYFLLGSFSSAFFLFGVAFLYGYSGSLRLSDIATATGATLGLEPLLLVGIALVAVGLLFKVSAVPFHSWTPDVYQGAPTPVTGFMAACTKVAAFGALMRVFYVALGGVRWDWRPMMWIVCIATMVVGSLLAVTQTDVKRLLAYSSIAHAGFILVGVLAIGRAGISATLFYLVTYGFTTIGAFAVVTLVRDAGGEATHLSRWAGLGRRSPVVASVFALFLLALAGIPLTSGFTGKFAVFSAAAGAGATPLVIVGVLASAVAAFFYIRIIVLMFFSEPAADGPTVAIPSVFTTAAVAMGAAVTVVLGIAPQPLLDLADRASVFLR
ncbi:MAG: NADH-quinone oxidoreductase subunit NuoN [Actinomycetes bacterium]